MPGNCEPATFTGSLLVKPPYPKPENILAEILENKTGILKWEQPENIFGESNFSYNITASVAGRVVEQRVVTLEPWQAPLEQFNFTETEDCEEVLFTLTQLGDCREQLTTTAIPKFPGPFLSEIVTETLYSENGDVGRVELTFQPPDLCEFQMEAGSCVLSITNETRSWTVGPLSLSPRVVFSDEHWFSRDSRYTVTATIITQQGNVSSNTTFRTLAEARLDEDSVVLVIGNDSSVSISWENPTNTQSESFSYDVSAVVVGTGEMVALEQVVVSEHDTPVKKLYLGQYVCEQVNISVLIFNTAESISKIVNVPARPPTFQKNVIAEPFMVNGEIKELEVSFTPPWLCEFQRSGYVVSFSGGSESWSREPVALTDTSREIKEDIETGFVVNRNYSVTVTVMMAHGNLSSTTTFIFMHKEKTDFLPVVLGAAGAGTGVMVVVCACLVAALLFCYLQLQRKKRERTVKTLRPNVTNPIYETGDDVYEELPDVASGKQLSNGLYTDVAPPLPSVRYDHLPPAVKLPGQKGESTPSLAHTLKDGPSDKVAPQLTIPPSGSTGALSAHSAEDCYTVMSPAGTLTVVPRSRHSGLAGQWGATPPGE
jgi:hypothetical protein